MKIAEWLTDEDKLKGAEVFATALTLVSGAIWVYLDGFTGETIAQVTATLGTALIIIVTFLYKMKQQQVQDYAMAGTIGLGKLQQNYPKHLSGPRSFKGNDTGDADGDNIVGKRYLFYQRQSAGEMAQFIPTAPFQMADIEIHVSRKALRILNIPMDRQEELKGAVKAAVLSAAERDYKGLFDVIEPKSTEKNLCIKLDFIDELNSLSYKKFEKAVCGLGQVALETLLKRKSGEA